MVKVRDSQLLVFDQAIDIETWFSSIAEKLGNKTTGSLRNACILAQLAGEEEGNFLGESCFRQGLVMGDILADIGADQDTIAAAIIHSSIQYADLRMEDVREHLGSTVARLIDGVCKMDAASTFEKQTSSYLQDHTQIDKLRRMLLAMVEDVRVVLIKLAERLYLLRGAITLQEPERKRLAQETLDIYAPLASRLGIGQLKWELEDLAFRYLEPTTYKKIAALLDQRRIEREQYVATLIQTVESALQKETIFNFKVYGRAKHIYSIYRKMQRKQVGFEKIYDAIALRILVDNLEDCYKALSCVHTLWEPIPTEFDDYIALPKPNGYRSIHTAVKGPDYHNVEVQIRTLAMHEESELGVAAHWIYKEGKPAASGYEQKIAWLRQVLEWQNELAKKNQPIEALHSQAFDDRIYVFTPAGQVLELPKGATPLDFAYHIHSEVGHRCKGAKVNTKIVPLIHSLQTGDQVEIITGKDPAPSRDWLSPHLGFLKSPRAKAKVHHWFKQQDYQRHLAEGESLFTRESRRLHLKEVDLNAIASKLHYKTKGDLMAALGCGDLRVSQILSFVEKETEEAASLGPPEAPTALSSQAPTIPETARIAISGVSHLMTYIAKCCHPAPGDPVIGYITISRGLTLHHRDCPNLRQHRKHRAARFIEVEWGKSNEK
ncbi:MAG: relA [Gammaproteobacteria bacterium]|nr:relA [Gammaproteobacteria bacterium]